MALLYPTAGGNASIPRNRTVTFCQALAFDGQTGYTDCKSIRANRQSTPCFICAIALRGSMALFCFLSRSRQQSEQDCFRPSSLFYIDPLPVRKPYPVLRTRRSVYIYILSKILGERTVTMNYQELERIFRAQVPSGRANHLFRSWPICGSQLYTA